MKHNLIWYYSHLGGTFRSIRWKLDDKYALEQQWQELMGYPLDLNHPRTFNEKLQWLKLYDRKPEYTMMVDKYRAKKWVAKTIGSECVIPTLAVWNSVEAINVDNLPNKFVLKCNHDSGSVVICEDKETFDIEAAKNQLGAAMNHNYFWEAREWPYKHVKRCVFAEQYLEDPEEKGLVDYKLMVFNGKVRCSFTCTNRRKQGGLRVTFYNENWVKMPFERHYPAEEEPMEKPTSYETMVDYAERLSEHIPFARVDFYEIAGKPYFSEITFYPGAGYEEFNPSVWDNTLGNWIDIPV